MYRRSTFRHKQWSPDPSTRGALMLPAPCGLHPSLHCADTDIDCWITTPLPESIKSLHRIDLAVEESGSGKRGAVQQDSEIHRWIFVSPWPALSVIFFCVLKNRREKTDSTGDGADSVIYYILIMQDIWLSCIKYRSREKKIQTFKDFPLLDIIKSAYSCFLLLIYLQIQV